MRKHEIYEEKGTGSHRRVQIASFSSCHNCETRGVVFSSSWVVPWPPARCGGAMIGRRHGAERGKGEGRFVGMMGAGRWN